VLAGVPKNPDQPYQRMECFVGMGYYPIVRQSGKYAPAMIKNTPALLLDTRMSLREKLYRDTKALNAQPHWKFGAEQAGLTDNMLKQSFFSALPDAFDATDFYHTSHQSSQKNTVEILDWDEKGRLLIRLCGKIDDVNYYDGSKPKSKLQLPAWFTAE